jgi:hypothetical protein
MTDKVGQLFSNTWKDIVTQRSEALGAADWATLLRAEGAQVILLHIAKSMGYNVEEQSGQGQAAPIASSKPKRSAKAKS